MDNAKIMAPGEVSPVSKRKQYFFAVVVRDVEAPNPFVVEAASRTELKKVLAADGELVEVIAIFRGHRVKFEEKRAINFC